MTDFSQKSFGVSVVIPNYNGHDLLCENLPSVFQALKYWGGEYELIIVDDCSSDDSCRLIAEQFSAAKLIVNSSNQGFSKTCNIGMAAARFPILLCVNTDVKVAENLIEPLVNHFYDHDVFAVTPNIIVERDGKNQGRVSGAFRHGFLKGSFAGAEQKLSGAKNLYGIGACVAYHTEKFKALGGYSEIYTPYLFEDVDICYRAWKRGWSSLYEPATEVWHYSNATLGKAKKRRNKIIYFRNRFIFHWTNLTDSSFLFWNLTNTFVRLMFSFLWCNFVYYEAFWGALQRLPEILSTRKVEREHLKMRDEKIIRLTTISEGTFKN